LRFSDVTAISTAVVYHPSIRERGASSNTRFDWGDLGLIRRVEAELAVMVEG
jgi:hypothetical protein